LNAKLLKLTADRPGIIGFIGTPTPRCTLYITKED
jgi:hypothetical protein